MYAKILRQSQVESGLLKGDRYARASQQKDDNVQGSQARGQGRTGEVRREEAGETSKGKILENLINLTTK